MTETLLHRGPDAGELWLDRDALLVLGHRRLSIVDLSAAGAQPMVSSCGRFVISYNGEVYNADEIKPELEAAGRRFRGHCDTEIIVEGAAQWGVEAIVKRLIGMFAMALWDRRERVLYLVRDRLGIKPVYWAEIDGRIVFGSELKALRADIGWAPALDRDAVAAYLSFGYVPAPHAIYRGISKLPPGTILTVRQTGDPQIAPFWSLADVARDGQNARLAVPEDEAVDRLDALLRDAVGRRMVADVPLGAFLSGGINSSTVVALMQAQSTRPVRSFTIGFHERGFDEAQHAAAVARHLGTEHTELYVSPQETQDVIPRLAEMYDEPFADSSRDSDLSRVGDDAAASHRRAVGRWRRRALRRLQALFPSTETVAGDRPHAALAATARRHGHRCAAARGLGSGWQAHTKHYRPTQFGAKMRKLGAFLGGAAEASPFYRETMGFWLDPENIVKGGAEPKGPLDDARIGDLVPDFIERMQYLDTLTYLPDDILTKVDRASMAVSLEARVPILDHRVVAFSWTLPQSMKVGDGAGKSLLRRVLHRYVPRELVERPKKGFAIPVGLWLKGELRDWAEALLDERRLGAEGIFDPAPIRARWSEHLAGTHDWQYPLWAVLMFQSWKERWLP